MPERTVESNLACFLNDRGPPVISRQQVDTVLFDCSKHFDSFNHYLLLRILSTYGLSRELGQQFGIHLKGRSNWVCCTAVTSRPFSIISRNLKAWHSALFSNIFVNDICPVITHCSLPQYAGDMKLYRAASSPDYRDLLQNDINEVSAWRDKNYLKHNLS